MSPVCDSGRAARATLRLQLHADYTLHHARADLPYFRRLGVTHLYLSPVSQSRTGSTHGYDVVDHSVVDTARGGEPALRALAAEARQAGMGLLLDIVPNHMATDPANAWWWDLLTHGPASDRAAWFDIDWEAPQTSGKVLAPFLGRPYAAALRAGDIRLDFDDRRGLHIAAQGQPWPLAPASLPSSDVARAGTDAVFRSVLLAQHDPRSPEGRRRLHHLLGRQHYRLAGWREAAVAINWRRFFEVSELIGVCVEREEVFDAVHALPLRLYAEGLIDGLRIDHVDGLARPLEYCRRLHAAMQSAAGQRPAGAVVERPWLVVEKILAPDETLDARWGVSGTTGYDFAADVGALLHDAAGESALFRGWAELSGDGRASHAWLAQARQEMLDRHFVAERARLLRLLDGLIPGCHAALGRALDALLCHYPVYRSYVEEDARAATDRFWFAKASQHAARQLAGDRPALALLPELDRHLGGQPPRSAMAQAAVQRFQQLTPPLAAKSLEDTVFYRYGNLLSRNEVGSEPSMFALTVTAFHARNSRRASEAQDALLATATHDHKRGEDARARLAILSEIPGEWLNACRDWMQAYADSGNPRGAAAAFQYMLIQNMVGAWPPGLAIHDMQAVRAYLDRLVAWAVKALREGKLLSSWVEPDTDQEARWQAWLYTLAPGEPRHGLLSDIERFVARLEPGAIANGLIQTALRLTCPGVPDLYQGVEWRDFSLVDPDNRRPVDFQARARKLAECPQNPPGGEPAAAAPLAQGRWPAAAWSDGRVKQALVMALLALRRQCPEAFTEGYQPLPLRGPDGDRLAAFSRGGEIVVCAAVKCAAQLRADAAGRPALPPGWGRDSILRLPGRHPAWLDVSSGRMLQAAGGELNAAAVLGGFPLAVLRRVQG